MLRLSEHKRSTSCEELGAKVPETPWMQSIREGNRFNPMEQLVQQQDYPALTNRFVKQEKAASSLIGDLPMDLQIALIVMLLQDLSNHIGTLLALRLTSNHFYSLVEHSVQRTNQHQPTFTPDELPRSFLNEVIVGYQLLRLQIISKSRFISIGCLFLSIRQIAEKTNFLEAPEHKLAMSTKYTDYPNDFDHCVVPLGNSRHHDSVIAELLILATAESTYFPRHNNFSRNPQELPNKFGTYIDLFLSDTSVDKKLLNRFINSLIAIYMDTDFIYAYGIWECIIKFFRASENSDFKVVLCERNFSTLVKLIAEADPTTSGGCNSIPPIISPLIKLLLSGRLANRIEELEGAVEQSKITQQSIADTDLD